MGAVTDRILIEIATTEGPATVRAVDYDADARLSSMVLYDQNHVPVGVDAHFDAFDRKLRKHLAKLGYRTPQGGLILEVDRPIDAGSSWQLGVALTHAVAARGLLTISDRDATRVIWVTGAVGTSAWAAKGVEAVPRKLARSAARLRSFMARGVQVDVIVPLDNLAEAVNAAPEEFSIRPASDLGALLGGVLPGAAPAAPDTPRPTPTFSLPLAGAALLAIGGAAALLVYPPLSGDRTSDGTGGGADRPAEIRSGTPETGGDALAEARARVGACTELLAPVAPAELLAPTGFTTLPDFYRLINTPEEALARHASGIDAADVSRLCDGLPDASALAPEAAGLRREAELRLALYDIATGQTEQAAARLAGIDDARGDTLFVRALAARRGSRQDLIAKAASDGHLLAEMADALLVAAGSSGRNANAGLERLRAAAGRPEAGGLADGLLAALRFIAAELPPDGDPAARAEADAALLEGVMRLAAARAKGFAFPVEGAQLDHISARAPGMLGLSLADLTAEAAARLGPGAPQAGAVITAVGAETQGLAPGDVILAVGPRTVRARADAETALFAAISSAVRSGEPVGLTVMRARDGAERPLELAVPARLAAVPLPASLP